ncbi:Moenomycin biosynthesis protein MoeN5 [Streptomyces sp. NPDC000594]|uniref:Moenomycin biosynthesis protein MoeN5 n=1 Tax=Streptomyces sp. NPDC000594 TaxID=3154261 RepID=UPI003329D095
MTPPLSADYQAAMLVTESANRDRVTSFVAGNGGSPGLVDHVAAIRLYLRVPHFLTEWIDEPKLRAEVAAALVLDIVAMKLLDDLMDDDSGLDRIELACLCLHLHLTALKEMCALSQEPQAVADLLERDFTLVCTGQIRTKREPARNLDEWCANASTYGAAFLGCYGALAALCGRRPESIGPAREFAEAYGTLITMADDLTDYDRNGERAGNLGHLLLTGALTLDELTGLVDRLTERAERAARQQPVAHDLVPVVGIYRDDVLNRLLPRFRAALAV